MKIFPSTKVDYFRYIVLIIMIAYVGSFLLLGRSVRRFTYQYKTDTHCVLYLGDPSSFHSSPTSWQFLYLDEFIGLFPVSNISLGKYIRDDQGEIISFTYRRHVLGIPIDSQEFS